MKNTCIGTTPALALSWLLVATFVGGPTESRAADKIWNNGNGGAFGAAVNWFNGIPGTSDIAHFGMTSSNSIFLQVRYQVDFAADATNQAIKVEDDGVTFDLNGHLYTTTLLDANEIGNVTSRTGRLTITDGTMVVAPFANISVGKVASGSGSLAVSSGGLLLGPPSLLVGRFGNGTLTVNNGGDIIADNVQIGNNAGAVGAATITGAGSTLFASPGQFAVGNAGTGTLNVSLAGQVETKDGLIASLADSTGTATVDGTNSRWRNLRNLFVGNMGLGTLNITNGGRVESVLGSIGHLDGSEGAVLVDGPGSIWVASGNLIVGDLGLGTLDIKNGGEVRNAAGVIGQDPTGSFDFSTVSVDGSGSQWINSGDLTVANAGFAEMLVTNGGLVENVNAQIGVASCCLNRVLVSGSGSQWHNSGNVVVGDRGAGRLQIFSGGTVQGITGRVGVGSNLSIVDVSGAGSEWTTGDSLFIGEGGRGNLNITAGGRVEVGIAGQIGFLSESVGVVTVSGAGSQWTSPGLGVGNAGQGTLEIGSGGRVLNAEARIGEGGTGSGSARVFGAGSTWSISGQLLIGGVGTATLDIEDGGAVDVASVVTLSAGGVVRLKGGTFDTQTLVQGGQFQWFGGTLHVGTFNGDLLNQGGTLAPGHSAGSTIILGNYTQQSSGTMEIEIGGPNTQADFISVTGAALLDGLLKLDLINGFVPNPAEAFVVLMANGVSGAFINAPSGERATTADGRGSLVVHYGPDSAFEPAQIVLTDFRPTTAGDCNVNGIVDILDHNAFADCMFGPNVGLLVTDECRCFDVDGSGTVDLADFAEMQRDFLGD